MKMNDSFNTQFGKPPPGVVCRDRKAAYAVFNGLDRQVAVIRVNVRGRDEFWLPGGGMLEDESPEQTIIREVREELGRLITVRRKIGQAIQFFYADDEAVWYKMEAYFFAAELEGTTGDQPEYDLQWVDPVSGKSAFFHECHVWAAFAAAPSSDSGR
jgi:8-oxo-dGTP diphosphatase